MSTNGKKTKTTVEEHAKEESKKKFLGENPIATIVLAVASEIIFAIILLFTGKIANIFTVPNEITAINNHLGNIDTVVNDTNNSINDLNESYHELDKRIAVLEDKHGLYTAKIIPSQPLKDYIIETFSQHNPLYMSDPLPQDVSTLGNNMDTGEDINLEDVINQPLLIIYKNDTQDIVFSGMINSNNCWNGNCILNIYENNSLKSIIDAEYNNGILESYKQVFDFTTNAHLHVWSISYRNKESNYYSGESWHYVYTKYPESFNPETIDQDNIVTIDKFASYINTVSYLEGYYYGNIENGLYNDTTGNAQRIIYSNDGTVRMLYIGNFENGQLNDDTGNAWYIILGRDEITYYQYTGIFKDGQRIDDNGLEKISIEGIKEKIKNISFNCNLRWREEQDI